MIAGLPAVASATPGGSSPAAQSILPAAVRNGTKADQDAYRAALGFERVLLGHLVEEMAPAGESAAGPHTAAVHDALTAALVAGGGIGLGAQLYHSLKERP
jgi:hypothetical protein